MIINIVRHCVATSETYCEFLFNYQRSVVTTNIGDSSAQPVFIAVR